MNNNIILSVCKRTTIFSVFDKKASKTRLSKLLKQRSLLFVNDCFRSESNAVFGVFLQRLLNIGVAVFLLFSLSSYAIGTNERISITDYNFASLYNPGASVLKPESFVYNSSNNESTVYFLQNITQLKTKLDESETRVFDYQIHYKLFNSSNYSILESSTNSFTIDAETAPLLFYSYFTINAPEGSNYILKLEFKCNVSGAVRRHLKEINKTDLYAGQNYLVDLFFVERQPIFNNFVYPDHQYIVDSDRIDVEKVKVNYYSFDDKVALPPFSSTRRSSQGNLSVDSTFYYKLGDTIEFNLKGIYKFIASEGSEKGLYLLNGGDFYPEVRTVNQMVGPIKYLSTPRQYERIQNADNTKKAIDNFWFSKSNNLRNAKEQIRVYYNRVQLANTYFSDFRKGYQTDKGMIYILLGAPNFVIKEKNTETWYYGINLKNSEISFQFTRLDHPVSEYYYKLERAADYQSFWGQIISTWEAGRIFSIHTN